MDKRGKELGIVFFIIFGIFTSLFLIETLSAIIQNKETAHKIYDPETKTVTIKDIDDKEIAKIQLLTPQNVYVIRGKDRKIAEFEIDNKNNYSDVFNNMEFFDLNDKNKEINRNFTYKYKITKGQKEIPIYNEVCTPTGKGNETKCVQNKTGARYEDIVEWKELDASKELLKGNVTIGIFTDVLPNDRVEWIPTLFGVRIEEWAEWQDSFDTNLLAYWKFNESSGTTSVDSLGKYNLADMNDSWVPGLIGNAHFPNRKSVNSTVNLSSATIAMTVNFWANTSGFPSSKEILTDTHFEIYTAAAVNEVRIYIPDDPATNSRIY